MHESTDRPTLLEMLEEVTDLSAGLNVMLMPALLLAVPGIILFVVLPGILLLAVAIPLGVIAAAIMGPPYLVVRAVRRRRDRDLNLRQRPRRNVPVRPRAAA
jgi:Flp pilus assembly protein TadB